MSDKAYIVIKKVPYDVFQKGKKLNKVFKHFKLVVCALKREKASE